MMSASDVTPIVITRMRHDVSASDGESPTSFTQGFLREQDQRDREAGPRPRHFGITHHRCDFSNA